VEVQRSGDVAYLPVGDIYNFTVIRKC